MQVTLEMLLTVIANAAVTYGVIKTQLRYLRRDVDAAHRRLDIIKAPSAWIPEQDSRHD